MGFQSSLHWPAGAARLDSVHPRLVLLFQNAGLDDGSVLVPAGLQDAHGYLMHLEGEKNEVGDMMAEPIRQKEKALERFKEKISTMPSQNRAQQALADAELRLEAWLETQLEPIRVTMREMNQAIADQYGLVSRLVKKIVDRNRPAALEVEATQVVSSPAPKEHLDAMLADCMVMTEHELANGMEKLQIDAQGSMKASRMRWYS